MWELDYKESWAPKNWCFCTVVLEKISLDFKEIQPVHPKANQSWIFTGRSDAEAEALILWPPDAYSQRQHNIRYTIARVGGGGEKQKGICILHKCHKLRRNALVMFQINRSEQLHIISKPNRDLEKAMAPHSSTLAWRIPWTQEPGGLPSTGSNRVGHDWSDLAAAATVTSLAVQWIGIRLPMQGTRVQSLVQEDTTCFVSQLLSPLAWGPWSTREATPPTTRESPCTAKKTLGYQK